MDDLDEGNVHSRPDSSNCTWMSIIRTLQSFQKSSLEKIFAYSMKLGKSYSFRRTCHAFLARPSGKVLLKTGWITKAVVMKMVSQLGCKDFDEDESE